jgi:hypothetical protein
VMNNLTMQLWPVERLVPYENNAKIHDDKQVDRIVKSIRDNGWDQPIVVDRNGVIIKGHGRRLAALKLGLPEVPVIVRDDLNDEQVKAARLADNRVAMGDYSTELLQKELATINIEMMEGIFDKKELDFLSSDLGELNLDAFVSDLDQEVSKQAVETVAKVAETDEKPVKIEKALGFKTIPVRAERTIARMLALLQERYGKGPEEAFCQFMEEQLSATETAV